MIQPNTELNAADSIIVKDKVYFRQEAKIWLGLSLCGCIFGLISPGFDQWYLAWFGLIPVLFSTITSKNPPQAFYRSVFFGYGFNLVFTIFVTQFSPAVWPENLRPFTAAANISVWLLFSMQQAALVGTFCFIARWLPLTGGVLPDRDNLGKWRLPALFVLPLLWVLVFNKLGNHLSSLAIPWTLLEYSQYKQTVFIQCASLVGGIGISALIVMTNVAIASCIATFSGKSNLKDLAFPNRPALLCTAFLVQILIFGALIFGNLHLQNDTICNDRTKDKKEMISILQGNMLFGLNEINPAVHWKRYLSLAAASPPGICVWPEWSVPISISKFIAAFRSIGTQASNNKQDWIIGAVDTDKEGNVYNAACMLGKTGKLEKEIYRKQYLVPFGEHSPAWLLNSPLGGLCGTLTPSRKGYTEGTETVLFTNGKNKIVPLICCELVSPEIACRGVRAGGEVLIDCSNTMWFQTKLLGEQSFAVCTLRAVENHRYFVFGTSIGPSAFIDWHGRILKTSPMNKYCTLSQEVRFDENLTPFSRWFR